MITPWAGYLPARMDEFASPYLLRSFGLTTAQSVVCQTSDAVTAAAQVMGFPLVLKTAEGIGHKSHSRGVILSLRELTALLAACADLSARLGPRVIVQTMVEKGGELTFGCVVDPDCAPLVMVSPGGTLVELFDERPCARAPLDATQAETMIRRLKVSRLINGVRGDAPRDMAVDRAPLRPRSPTLAPRPSRSRSRADRRHCLPRDHGDSGTVPIRL
ncbi:hypothetical protein GC209_13620 [bacterium]|nr:hypothetical protein [bacterium]